MKIFKLIIIGIFTFCLLTGCKDKEKENTNISSNETQSVIEDQVFEGLEFINVGVSNGVIKTIVINNTGALYEGSKFLMKIMDENGILIVELTDEVKEKMETGTTKIIETKTDVDLTKAVSIEYSIVRK